MVDNKCCKTWLTCFLLANSRDTSSVQLTPTIGSFDKIGENKENIQIIIKNNNISYKNSQNGSPNFCTIRTPSGNFTYFHKMKHIRDKRVLCIDENVEKTRKDFFYPIIRTLLHLPNHTELSNKN